MSISHNKKKNTALLFEFLTLDVSKSLVTNDEKRAKIALKILEKYFKSETDLFKEYRIARALVSTRGINERVASKIIQESYDAVKLLKVKEMNEAKRKLLRDVHFKLGDEILDQVVIDYKIYATIYQLFELWRKDDVLVESRDIKKKAEFESALIHWLVEEEKTSVDEPTMLSEYSPGVRRLLIKKMTDRLNEKYSSRLSESQRKIIKSYAIEKNSESFKKMLKEVRDQAKTLSEKWVRDNPDDETSLKMVNVINLMEKEDYENLDSDSVVRHMSYTDLINEFLGNNR